MNRLQSGCVCKNSCYPFPIGVAASEHRKLYFLCFRSSVAVWAVVCTLRAPKCLDLELERCRYNFTDPYYSHAVCGSSGTRSDINSFTPVQELILFGGALNADPRPARDRSLPLRPPKRVPVLIPKLYFHWKLSLPLPAH